MAIAEDDDDDCRHLLKPSEETDAPTLLTEPFQALYGSGKDIWVDEHADEYVARLRGGWD